MAFLKKFFFGKVLDASCSPNASGFSEEEISFSDIANGSDLSSNLDKEAHDLDRSCVIASFIVVREVKHLANRSHNEEKDVENYEPFS